MKQIKDRKLTGTATNVESEEIRWLDDSVEDGYTQFNVEEGIFGSCGSVVCDRGTIDGGDIIESRWYDDDSEWDFEEE